MEKTINLLDMAENLLTLDRELTMYAAKPWTPESAAILAEPSMMGSRSRDDDQR